MFFQSNRIQITIYLCAMPQWLIAPHTHNNLMLLLMLMLIADFDLSSYLECLYPNKLQFFFIFTRPLRSGPFFMRKYAENDRAQFPFSLLIACWFIDAVYCWFSRASLLQFDSFTSMDKQKAFAYNAFTGWSQRILYGLLSLTVCSVCVCVFRKGKPIH